MDETKNLSETEDLQPPVVSSSGSQDGDSKKIGRYTILGRLGKGGFGEVFLAHDDDLNRPVAIKVPRPERVSQPEDIEAYLNEACILASLDHPHIVPVFDVGRTDDGLCFVVSKLVRVWQRNRKLEYAASCAKFFRAYGVIFELFSRGFSENWTYNPPYILLLYLEVDCT
jgi:serine/threonine protein kinase